MMCGGVRGVICRERETMLHSGGGESKLGECGWGARVLLRSVIAFITESEPLTWREG